MIKRIVLSLVLLAASFAASAQLFVSTSPTRSAPLALTGHLFDVNQLYIFATSATPVSNVAFTLDGKLIRTEGVTPYDLMGTAADGTAQPLDVTTYAPSIPHTLTAVYTFTTGGTLTETVSFARKPPPTPAPTPTPVPVISKKWYPGHYVNGAYGNDVPLTISRAKQSPNFTGVNFLHRWIDMETSKGVYNFAKIDAQLAAAKAANLRMMIQIMDQSYSGSQPCVPSYMRTDPVYGGGQSMIGARCVALRHKAAVQDRMNALYAALAAKYDSDPYFVGVSITEEDSYPTTGTNMAGYTDRALIDQEKRGITAAAQSFKRTPLFKWLNWGPGNAELFAHAATVGVGVGGPDLDPKSPTFSYPGNYQKYFKQIPLFLAVQAPRVVTTVRNGSNAAAIINYGVSAPPAGLGLNFIVWDQPYTPEIRFDTNIIPAINARPGVQTACPTTFAGCTK